jgi:hypothetical protein
MREWSFGQLALHETPEGDDGEVKGAVPLLEAMPSDGAVETPQATEHGVMRRLLRVRRQPTPLVEAVSVGVSLDVIVAPRDC